MNNSPTYFCIPKPQRGLWSCLLAPLCNMWLIPFRKPYRGLQVATESIYTIRTVSHNYCRLVPQLIQLQ